MPYPNRAQWIIIWATLIVAFYLWDQGGFFVALGGYTNDGIWLWPEWVRQDVRRIVPALLAATALLLWQFSRPVRLRSPILMPLGFIVGCLIWYVVGVVQQQRGWHVVDETPAAASKPGN